MCSQSQVLDCSELSRFLTTRMRVAASRRHLRPPNFFGPDIERLRGGGGKPARYQTCDDRWAGSTYCVDWLALGLTFSKGELSSKILAYERENGSNWLQLTKDFNFSHYLRAHSANG